MYDIVDLILAFIVGCLVTSYFGSFIRAMRTPYQFKCPHYRGYDGIEPQRCGFSFKSSDAVLTMKMGEDHVAKFHPEEVKT